MSGARHRLLEALVEEHLRLHGDDPSRSLRAVTSPGSTWEDLGRIADPELQASLARVVARGPHGTTDTSGHRSVGLRPPADFGSASSGRTPEGGLGEVFVARDEELQPRGRPQGDPGPARRRPAAAGPGSCCEAEITGGLEHPGIVPVYGLGRDADGRPYYAMRFIRGDSLKEAIAAVPRGGGPGPRPGRADRWRCGKLLRRFVDVCNAIAYAHSRGVLHRDLKPGNIMLGPYGETLVVDWGLAKLVGRPEAAAAAAEGTLAARVGERRSTRRCRARRWARRST